MPPMFLSARVSSKSFCSRPASRFAQIGPLFQAVIPRGSRNAQQILTSRGYRVEPPQPYRARNLSTPYEFGRDTDQQIEAAGHFPVFQLRELRNPREIEVTAVGGLSMGEIIASL